MGPFYHLRRNKTELIRTAYHEAGHIILAYLFDDVFVIKEVSINKRRMSRINKDYSGGANLRFEGDNYNADAADKLIAESYGGICAQTLAGIPLHQHQASIGLISNQPQQYRVDTGGGGDKSIIIQEVQILLNSIPIPPDQYREEVTKFVLNFFSEPETWTALQILAQAMLSRWNLTLSAKQIKKCLNKSGFDEYLRVHKTRILNLRYPIAHDKKKFNYFFYNQLKGYRNPSIAYRP